MLYQIHAVCTPSELHGLVCGRLAGGQRLSPEQWLEEANTFMDLIEGQIADHEADAIVGLYELALQSISDGELGFQALIPDDALPLAERIVALAAWVDAFLHGFGSADANSMETLSDESREIVNDLASISQVHTDTESNTENERSFAELSEFVRLGAHALFFEFNRAAPQTHSSTH